MRLLLDAHYSPAIAEQLRARGHDLVAAGERDDLRALPDDQLLAVATTEQRALVSNNIADFVPLIQRAAGTGNRHFGLVLTSDRTLPRSTRAIGRHVRALQALLQGHPAADGLADVTIWLG